MLRLTAAALILLLYPASAVVAEVVADGTKVPPAARGAAPDLDCIMEPSAIVEVGTGVPGLIEAMHADRADPVEAGAPLARLESGVEQATVDLARARAELTTDVELRRVSSGFGLRQQVRNEELFQKRVLSATDMDKLETEARLAKLQQRQAEDERRLAALELRRAEQSLKRRTILSPVSGVVTERYRSVGEYVEDKPLMRIARLDPLHVEVIAPLEWLGKVKPGMDAEVRPEPQNDSVYRATVARVDPVADPASGTFGVRLILPNPDNRIQAGLRCHLQFVSDQPLVPRPGVGSPSPAEAVRATDAPTSNGATAPILGPVAPTVKPLTPSSVGVPAQTSAQVSD